MNCLFLGYNAKETKIINFLKKKKLSVKNLKKNLGFKDIISSDIIISFGYRKIIKKEILKKLKRPIINLHMSYLPFNRGSNPNYWSFVNRTKKGVTIHEIDSGIDTGNIIYQKEIKFNLKKNTKLTFRSTYRVLFKELENLFIKNYKEILSGNYKIKINKKLSNALNKSRDLPDELKTWDINIKKYLKEIKQNEKK